MVPEVSLAERPGAAHTGLHCLQLPPDAGVTRNVPWSSELSCVLYSRRTPGVCAAVQRGPSRRPAPGRLCHHQTLELAGDLRQDPVDAHLGFSAVALLAHGAQEPLAVVPVALQTCLTEAVAARSGDGLHKDLQTNGATELVLREHPAHGRPQS